MIVLRRARGERFRPTTRGLLGWLHSDGVLVIPADLRPPKDGEVDQLLLDLTRALAEPVGGWPS